MYEDFKRHAEDKETNNSVTHVMQADGEDIALRAVAVGICSALMHPISHKTHCSRSAEGWQTVMPSNRTHSAAGEWAQSSRAGEGAL